MTNGLNQLPAKLYPHGTAVNNTAQQAVGAIGTAIFVTIMNTVATSKGEELVKAIDPSSLADPNVMASLQQQATLEGIQFSFLVATIISVVALVLTLFLKRVDVSRAKVEKKEQQ